MDEKDQNCENYLSSGPNVDLDSSVKMFSAFLRMLNDFWALTVDWADVFARYPA